MTDEPLTEHQEGANVIHLSKRRTSRTIREQVAHEVEMFDRRS